MRCTMDRRKKNRFIPAYDENLRDTLSRAEVTKERARCGDGPEFGEETPVTRRAEDKLLFLAVMAKLS